MRPSVPWSTRSRSWRRPAAPSSARPARRASSAASSPCRTRTAPTSTSRTRTTSSYDGGQLAYLLESPAGSLLVSASAGYWRGIFEPIRPDVAILGATGRPVLDGEPYQGSLAGFLAEQAALLGHPEVILCHYDPLLPPLLGATDISAAETRLKEMPDQGYLRLEYGAPIAILPKRS